MFSILISALNTGLGFLFRTIAVKFVVFTAIYLVVSEFVPFISGKLPDVTYINKLFEALPDSVIYFINVFALDECIPILVSASFTRFFIRRLPVIG